MERVAFLIEDTDKRLDCLLNPESLSVSRVAGLRSRRSTGGPLTGAGLSDDPLLYTGGGVTELKLDLLFDTSIAGSTIRSEDIRDLTLPLRELAENTSSPNDSHQRQPPVARFIWGKAWNIRGVVAAIAENLESFTANGVPRRSWLRLRFVRVDEQSVSKSRTEPTLNAMPNLMSSTSELMASAQSTLDGTDVRVHEVIGDMNSGHGSRERLEEIAYRHYGNASCWRLIAAANNIVNPHDIAAGTRLTVPSLSILNRLK